MTDDRVRQALASLDAAPPSSSWRDVRSVVRRRRRVRGVAAGVVVIAAAAVVVVPRLGGTDGGAAPPPTPLAAGIEPGAHLGSAVELVSKTAPLSNADPSAVSSVATAEQDFTAALLQHVATGTDNVSVSPASLAIALAMLQNGARRSTRTEILAAMQSSGISPTRLDEGWAGLTAQWSTAAKSAGIDFSSANSLWQQRGLPLRKEFMAALARYYASGVWQVDFAHHMGDALAAMNQWTSQHTNGKIAKLFDQLDPSTLLVLANAVYFHASWLTPFDASQSKPAPFVAADGSRSTATFMTTPGPVSAARTNDFEAAQLPYAGGRFAALAVMPTHGSLAGFIGALDAAGLSKVASSLTSPMQVQLPRFTTTSETNLSSVLPAMGMRTAFTDNADFSALSPTSMKVGDAIQRVYLKVGEKGTEAAAATGIGMVPTMALNGFQGITFDHPFLFLIRDTKTGAVLFASAVNRPDAAA